MTAAWGAPTKTKHRKGSEVLIYKNLFYCGIVVRSMTREAAILSGFGALGVLSSSKCATECSRPGAPPVGPNRAAELPPATWGINCRACPGSRPE